MLICFKREPTRQKVKIVKQAKALLMLFIVFEMVFPPISALGYAHTYEAADSSDLKDAKSVSPFSSIGGNWNFSRVAEWGNFACVDNDSAELVVGINNTRSENYAELVNLTTEKGGTIVNKVSLGGKPEAVVVDLPLDEVSPFADEVQQANLARYVEPNMKLHVDFVPNDPEWTKQWGPKKIEADYAWNTTTGNSSILVAVIDTGVDYNHPDLNDNYNSSGYDWVNNDSDPMDDNSHGTHCAGIIAAEINNSIGVAGLAQVRFMAEKAFNQSGGGLEDDVANAIIHAVDQGADILSNSWGDYEESQLIRNAIDYAYANGLLIIAAAGNEDTSSKLYPAAYDEVIAVTATDSSDTKASFSNYGNWVELAAPGVNIYSTIPVSRGSYGNKSGTSMACPYVTGVAALIWSKFPNVTRDWVRAQLRYTSDDLGASGFDQYYGYGRVNARRAVEEAPPSHDLLIIHSKISSAVELGENITADVTVFNFGFEDENNVTAQFLINGTTVDSVDVGFLASGTSTTVSCSWTPRTKGTYNVTAYVLPVLGENNTANNLVSSMVRVRYVEVALISDWTELSVLTPTLDSMGIDYDTYNYNEIYFYTANSSLLLSYPAVIFYKSASYYRLLTPREYSTLNTYLTHGGSLLVTGLDSLYSDALLADIVRSSSYGDDMNETDLFVVNASHPIMNGSYGSFSAGYNISGLFSDCDAVKADTTRNAVTVAELADGYDKIIATELHPGKVVFWNGDGTSDWTTNNDCKTMFKNTLAWFLTRYEHELVVSLGAPNYVEPGVAVFLNATVYNRGLNNETVDLFLLINGTVVNSTTLPNMMNGTSRTLSHLWMPTNLAAYNVTVHALPVSGESFTTNNVYSAYVVSRMPLISPKPGDYAHYIFRKFASTTNDTVVETYLWNFTYLEYVELHVMNVTIDVTALDAEGNHVTTTSYWMNVDTMTRWVETGDAGWEGTYYVGWVETGIGFGSEINLWTGTGTVMGTSNFTVDGRNFNTWLITIFKDPNANNYYDQSSGLLVAFDEKSVSSDYHSNLTLLETNIDVTPPTVHVTSPVQGAAVASTNVTVNWTGEDNETGIDHYSVYLNETLVGNTTANSYNVSSLTEGWNNITVVAYDKAGNNASDRISIFVDLNPPNVEIISPHNGYAINVGNVTVEWIGSDNETEIAHYLVYLDNVQVANTTNTVHTLTDLIEGHHTIKIEAYDRAGNMQSDEITVIVDMTVPELSVISPENGSFVSDHVTVQFFVFDANLHNVTYQINNSTPIGVTGETNFTVYTALFSDGAFNITIIVMDKALNAVNQTLTLIADNTAPAVSIFSPRQGAELLGTATINFSASDANLKEVHLYIDGAEVNITGTTVYSWDTATAGDGVHTIRLVAIDKAGNAAEATVTVITANLRRTVEDTRNFFFMLGTVAGVIIGALMVYFARRQKPSTQKGSPRRQFILF